MTERTSDVTTNDVLIQTSLALTQRNIHTSIAENAADAKQLLIDLIPRNSEVYVSTSETLDSIGYTEHISQSNNYKSLNELVTAETDLDTQKDVRRRVTTIADYFVGSVQAISASGEVIIASGSGSQIAAYVYGAKKVFWVAGIQKICQDLPSAIERVRGYTLEKHDQWLEGYGRSAAPVGKLLIFEHEQVKERVHMILVKETLGW
tara:strand:- start:62 stop:679 length:618 start_codon:yes stop_codon:yes gene_type:complete